MTEALAAGLFRIDNADRLLIPYRRFSVVGLSRGDAYDRNIELLRKELAYRMRAPIGLVRADNGPAIAVPIEGIDPPGQVRLTPDVVRLVPFGGTSIADPTSTDPEERAVAGAFIAFGISGALRGAPGLWGQQRRWWEAEPLARRDGVVAYRGFHWTIVDFEHWPHLVIDTAVRYLSDGPPRADQVLRRHCSYLWGGDRFDVQVWAVTDQRADAAEFSLPSGEVWTVWDSTAAKLGPAYLDQLGVTGEDRAVVYKTAAGEERKGMLGLCRRHYRTDELPGGTFHQLSQLAPAERLAALSRIVDRWLSSVEVTGRPIVVNPHPVVREPTRFPFPELSFSGGRTLRVEGGDAVGVAEYPSRRRREMLAGVAASRARLGQPVLLQPMSLRREVNDDFHRRLEAQLGRITGDRGLRLRRLVYEDRRATSTLAHVAAVRRSLGGAGLDRATALLVLPEHAPAAFHNAVKAELWDAGHRFQCADAARLLRFYRRADATVIPGQEGKLARYLENLCIGLLLQDQHWPWRLAGRLNAEVHIGIDVLGDRACFVFVYQGGARIRLQPISNHNDERLSASQVRRTLVRQLHVDLSELALRPERIVLHRDGRVFASEVRGAEEALDELRVDGLVPLSCELVAVEVRKTASHAPRLFRVDGDGAIRPAAGDYFVLSGSEGALCLTGTPFDVPGTPRTILVRVAHGELGVVEAMYDIFALAQLAFAAPALPVGLPVTLWLADDLLETIAGGFDRDDTHFGDTADRAGAQTWVS